MKKEFKVKKTGNCKIVFIPRGYCTIYLENQVEDHIEMSREDKHVCIENLASDLPCQKILKKKSKIK